MESFHHFYFGNLLVFLSFSLLLVVENANGVAIAHKTNGVPTTDEKKPLPPIILIPGSMATKLYVHGTNTGELEKDCNNQKSQEYKKVWISEDLKDEKRQKCIFAQLRLGHDGVKSVDKHPELKVYTKSSHEEKFGSLDPTICLYTDELGYCQYSITEKLPEANFGPLVKWLTEDSGLGYIEGENLFAAPYDWRYEANNPHMESFYNDLTHLIETKTKNAGQRALLILHSLGNNVGNYFLTRKKDEHWQKTHIAATINVAAPFGGTVEVLEEVFSGNAKRYFDTLPVTNEAVLPFARSLGSIATLLPNSLAFEKNQNLISINGQWKTLADMEELLKMAGLKHFYQIYKDTIPKPQLHTKMYCIYGLGKKEKNTPLSYTYGTKNIEVKPTKTVDGYGDDTINEESLRVCDIWKKQHPKMFGEIKVLDNVGHAGIISNSHFYGYIGEVVAEIQIGN